ncbi:hypothetical protein A5631_01070 [Mycolicibacter heraklionensis]|nr:hypothetical protein A5631_01070 [Mycolicibacter heraklionensis]
MTTTETTVTELTADSTDAWRVTTLVNVHFFGLDNCSYERPRFAALFATAPLLDCWTPAQDRLSYIHR